MNEDATLSLVLKGVALIMILIWFLLNVRSVNEKFGKGFVVFGVLIRIALLIALLQLRHDPFALSGFIGLQAIEFILSRKKILSLFRVRDAS